MSSNTSASPTPPIEPQALRQYADECGQRGYVTFGALPLLRAAADEIERLREDCLTWESQHAAVLSLCERLQGPLELAAQIEGAAQALDDWFGANGPSSDLFMLFMELHAVLAATARPSAG